MRPPRLEHRIELLHEHCNAFSHSGREGVLWYLNVVRYDQISAGARKLSGDAYRFDGGVLRRMCGSDIELLAALLLPRPWP
jgi:hypothetical protein